MSLPDGTPPDEKKECTWCQKLAPAFGILLGVAFLYISIDLMTGGKITGAITKKGGGSDGTTVDAA